MAKTKKTELERVNINLPIAIVSKVKEYAESLGLNTTSAYIVLLNQALEQKEMMNNLPLMYSMINEIQKVNNNLNIDNNSLPSSK